MSSVTGGLTSVMALQSSWKPSLLQRASLDAYRHVVHTGLCPGHVDVGAANS